MFPHEGEPSAAAASAWAWSAGACSVGMRTRVCGSGGSGLSEDGFGNFAYLKCQNAGSQVLRCNLAQDIHHLLYLREVLT
jgi:hypothetical protein